MALCLYDEEALKRQFNQQTDKAWDLEKSIPWDRAIDFNKPLIPLDEHALVFPGASREQRLAIAHMFGLIVAKSISEMEETLIRLRTQSWTHIHEAFPVSPEFVALGDLFFEEERKHSEAFDRYVKLFAHDAGLDQELLKNILPSIRDTKTEWILKKNLESHGQSFWWIVASVEQEFLAIYKALEPHKTELEPLYFDIHHKHFEEEARHASFPYLMLELLTQRNSALKNFIHVKTDLMFSQVIKALWTFGSLRKIKTVRDVRKHHPLLDALASALPLLEKQGTLQVSWELFMRTPYVSSLIHPRSHKKIVRAAKDLGAIVLPCPEINAKKKSA